MTRAFALEALGIALERCVTYATAAGLDQHIISDIKHVAATVEANKEPQQCQHQ